MKILKYYDQLYQAEMDRQLLTEEGIPSEIFNELLGQVVPQAYVGNSVRPYLAVPDSFYREAAELLGIELPDRIS